MATQQQRRDVNHFQNYPIKFFFFSFEFYLMYTAALFFLLVGVMAIRSSDAANNIRRRNSFPSQQQYKKIK
jgi:hypothetical protein